MVHGERKHRAGLVLGLVLGLSVVLGVLAYWRYSLSEQHIKHVLADMDTRGAALGTAEECVTEVLDWHVAQHPDRLHVTVLQDDRTAIASLCYAELANAARAVAAGLIARDIRPGDRIALMLPTGTDIFAALFGILYVGAIPVPIYPPMQLTQIEEYARRQAVCVEPRKPRKPRRFLRRLHCRILSATGFLASASGIIPTPLTPPTAPPSPPLPARRWR